MIKLRVTSINLDNTYRRKSLQRLVHSLRKTCSKNSSFPFKDWGLKDVAYDMSIFSGLPSVVLVSENLEEL